MTSSVSAEAFFQRRDTTPPGSLAKAALSARLAIAQAHERYLKAIYYIPFTVSFISLSGGLEQLVNLVSVGDSYDSLSPLRLPVECLINRHVDAVRKSICAQSPKWMQISFELKIDWLFKEVVRRVCVDSGKSDKQVTKQFLDELGSLILQKRDILRRKITEIDLKLLTMHIPKGKAVSHDAAVLRIREIIIRAVRDRPKASWNSYTGAYASIMSQLDEYRREMTRSDLGASERSDIKSLFLNMKHQVSGITHLNSDLSMSELDPDCIDFQDADLPWNKE
ncbi:MAG: hypothetical protein Q9169_007495 [Polycauliona sp. 2 TL-2023]